MFVGEGANLGGPSEADAYDAEHAGLTLADVAGMTEVKQRLEAAFLAPMRNPDLRRLYGKSLRGGLLLYGPPGCGKTFIARAVAGELGAQFIAVSFADIIDMFVGQSERNIHELFEIARRNAPCVLFLDEVDAIGQKRSQLRQHSDAQRGQPAAAGAGRHLGQQRGRVPAGRHQPPVGRGQRAAPAGPVRPDAAGAAAGRGGPRGRVPLPPQGPAGGGHRPGQAGPATDGYSGADIAHICETAAERALLDSVRAASRG